MVTVMRRVRRRLLDLELKSTCQRRHHRCIAPARTFERSRQRAAYPCAMTPVAGLGPSFVSVSVW